MVAWRGFLIAWRAPDAFARLFATGLTCMLTLQALVNIAVVTNSLPYTGVTLPLVSFGGSSTVISLIAVGLLLNISRHPVPRRDADGRTTTDGRCRTPEPGEPRGNGGAARTRRARPSVGDTAPMRVAPTYATGRGVPELRPARRRSGCTWSASAARG